MSRTDDALARSDLTLAAIASGVGYGNAFAFATAFRRKHNLSLGGSRHRQRSGAQPT